MIDMVDKMNVYDLQNPLLDTSPLFCGVRRTNGGYKAGGLLKRKGLVECLGSRGLLGDKKFCLRYFGGRHADFSARGNLLKYQFKIRCIKESFIGSNTLVKSFVRLYNEGLLLLRCSVFIAVISAVGLLVWYGQMKAKAFIEAQLLPSVCSILSEQFQRDLTFGKVHSLSPLGISLDSGSIGPHGEEFSCGEIPRMKVRVHPFASLRRGKIVVDAVLFRPNVLVAQKEDFSWMGIPSSTVGDVSSVSRRHSSEVGIEYKTKTRRAAREKATALWFCERSLAAKKAAEVGYIVPEQSSDASMVGVLNDGLGSSTGPSTSSCIDERMHWRDHHCIDTDVEYSMKHADLEKSFGVKISRAAPNIWSRVRPRPIRQALKRNFHKKELISEDSAPLQKNLERSRVAAIAYFRRLEGKKLDETSQEKAPSVVMKDDGDNEIITNSSNRTDEQKILSDAFDLPRVEEEKRSEDTPIEVAGGSFGSIQSGGMLKCDEHKNGKCVGNLDGGSDSFRWPFFMFVRKVHTISASSDHHATAKNGDLRDTQTEDSSEGHRASHGLFFAFRLWMKIPWSNFVFPSKMSCSFQLKHARKAIIGCLFGVFQKLKSSMIVKLDDLVAEFSDGYRTVQSGCIEKLLPLTVDSVNFSGGTLVLLGYGDREPRVLDNVNGHVKFQNNYGQVHVQLSGFCREWRSELSPAGGGCLATDVFVDSAEQKWHANIKVANVFAPLFERILGIPLKWHGGRASGEVHICMSRGESFPNLHGQLDVKGLDFAILDSPSNFTDVTASLCFRGHQIFVHNASGWFGEAPLEASGDFGLNPKDGEFHLMCQVPSVEVNALMRTFKMRPLVFPVAGLVSAVFNCQGPLDAPIFVGSGMILQKAARSTTDFAPSAASDALSTNKEAGAVAAFDRIPLSYLSANFTYNTDNSVADLYGIRAALLDGGEIRVAGNVWICPEGELDNSAMEVNLSGSFYLDKLLQRYLPSKVEMVNLKIGELNGEAKLSGSLLKPRFDIKWAAPKAEESFSDARGDIIISHEYAIISSSSVSFDLYTKVQTTYTDDLLQQEDSSTRRRLSFKIEGIDLDLRMRGFEFYDLFSSYSLDSLRPIHLKATGRIKFQGKVVRIEPPVTAGIEQMFREANDLGKEKFGSEKTTLIGDVSLTGIKLNQLILAPQLIGSFSISDGKMKLEATGRPDENLVVEAVGSLQPSSEDNLQNRKLTVFLQKGQLRSNICYQPECSASLEVRNLPLDELELASLRGTVQRAELQLNSQKRRGHGILSLLHPKFSGVLGEALDLAARWSGDVITVEKTILEQVNSKYELQGEYVLPGSRDRYPDEKESGGFLKMAMAGHLGNAMSSIGRWRMRLEVPAAEVSEMLPLARLLSCSTDPSVQSRSKDFFIQSLPSMGFYAESLRNLLEALHKHFTSYDEIIYEDWNLPGLAELKGRWCGSLDASGGGNGDTMAEFDFRGEDWEWGTYRTQRVEAEGAYSNNSGLHFHQFFIQKDNATLHADGTLLGPKTNLHFAVLNLPIGLVPTIFQIFESSKSDLMHSLCRVLNPMKGILHMEGDLRGSLAKPECDVQVRLLDGAMGGIDLGKAEIVASLTSSSRFLFNANIEPVIQSGHVHVQGSVPITSIQNVSTGQEDVETGGLLWFTGRGKDKVRGFNEEPSENKVSRDRNEEGWDIQLEEGLKGLNWNFLDAGEVRIDADVKDGGMMLITAFCPHADWLHGNADIFLQVRGTVEQPIVDGSASFHRASVSSPVLRKPFSNIGGTVHVKSNRLCISSLEGRVSRKGKLSLKGNLPLQAGDLFPNDKVDLKCEYLELHAKNILSGQVDSQLQINGSILQPNVSGMIKLSVGEAYLPQDKGNGEDSNRLTSSLSVLSTGGHSRLDGLKNAFPYLGSSRAQYSQSSGKHSDMERTVDQETVKPRIDVCLTDLKLFLGPELRIVYPLFLNFAVSGKLELNGIAHAKYIKPKGVLTFENGDVNLVATQRIDVCLTDLKLFLGPELRIVYPLFLNFAVSGKLELNGIAHAKYIKPKGVLTFENGDVNLVATQMRLKRDHTNRAKFEPDLGLDPILDLVLVGSDWQFRIQSRASNWQDNLVVTSTHSVEQDALSPVEAAKIFESQLAGSLLEVDGQLAFKKLARATLETLMPRIEGKGEFGQARWRLVYAPQIPSLRSLNPSADPLKSLASDISFNTEVEVQLGKRLQASIVRQMMDSEMATQWTLLYQLTSRLRVLVQISSNDSKRILFQYSASSQD